jgi:hypothetical protein
VLGSTIAITCGSCIAYCQRHLDNLSDRGLGHWHYAHYYYAQALYRRGGEEWRQYRDRLYARLIREQNPDGSWTQGYVGPVYTTALNLTMLQLEKGGPANLSALSTSNGSVRHFGRTLTGFFGSPGSEDVVLANQQPQTGSEKGVSMSLQLQTGYTLVTLPNLSACSVYPYFVWEVSYVAHQSELRNGLEFDDTKMGQSWLPT